MISPRHFLDDERGSTMVEFALVIGVIFLPLLFGVLEFGRATWTKTMVTAAAREGVRYAIVHGAQSGAVADSATIANYVKGRTQLTPIDVQPSWVPDKAPGSVAQVRVTYTYVPAVSFVIRSTKTITSTSRQIIAF